MFDGISCEEMDGLGGMIETFRDLRQVWQVDFLHIFVCSEEGFGLSRLMDGKRFALVYDTICCVA